MPGQGVRPGRGEAPPAGGGEGDPVLGWEGRHRDLEGERRFADLRAEFSKRPAFLDEVSHL